MVCAGELVTPGDAIVADGGGVVVVVPAARVPEVAGAAARREANEVGKRAKLGAGVLGLNVNGIGETLAKAGLCYEDRAS